MVDCLKCVNSACCRLEVEVNRSEYDRLLRLGLADKMATNIDAFLIKNPKYKKHALLLEKMYKDNFATIKKGTTGNCILLDNKMECTIYEDRPTVCKDYDSNRCGNIRELKQ